MVREPFLAEELVPDFDRVDFLVTRATVTIEEEEKRSKSKKTDRNQWRSELVSSDTILRTIENKRVCWE